MKTPEQLKGAIRNIALKKNLRAQEVLQMFFFERILERLAVSEYKDNFILKGGLLISSMIGIQERTTMDMDTTVKGIDMSEDNIEKIVKDVLEINIQDGVIFEYQRTAPIREVDDYNNYRVYLKANYGKTSNPMQIDITTGDEITPSTIEYKYPLMFEKRSISLMAYPLETTIAEKYETIIRRGTTTTRARDFYDLYTLYNIYKNQINVDTLKLAIENTARKRESLNLVAQREEIVSEIRSDKSMKILWDNYTLMTPYASNISFEEVLEGVIEIGNLISTNEFKTKYDQVNN